MYTFVSINLHLIHLIFVVGAVVVVWIAIEICTFIEFGSRESAQYFRLFFRSRKKKLEIINNRQKKLLGFHIYKKINDRKREKNAKVR